MYAPADARDAGYLDAVVAAGELDAAAQAAAQEWAKLPQAAYTAQVRVIRGARIAALEAAVAADRAGGAGPITG
jgi:enoyl-CoA hydratase/carnithine racemase